MKNESLTASYRSKNLIKMEVKKQWMVIYQNNYQILTLTENNGYYLGYETNGFCFWKIKPEEAKILISTTKIKEAETNNS